MPFKSKSQQRFMFAEHPQIAERWADHTPDIKALPEKIKQAGYESALAKLGLKTVKPYAEEFVLSEYPALKHWEDLLTFKSIPEVPHDEVS